MNRELRLALLLCSAGAVLLLLAGGRTWGTVLTGAPAPLPEVRTALTGADLVPGLRPLALAALAGAAALLAARPRWRPLVGLLVALVGAAAAAVVLDLLRDPLAAVLAQAPVDGLAADTLVSAPGGVGGGWAWAAVAGGLLVAASGLLVLARGRRWAGLAARYDAPAARQVPAATSAWDDLDRGVDPTGDGTGDSTRAPTDDPTGSPRTSVPGSTPAQEETP